MKKIMTLVVFLSLSLGTTLSAQSYKSAIGLRLGVPWAASYKTFFNETSAIEAYGSFRSRGYGGFGYSYRWTILGLGATYQVHKDLNIDIDGLQWFFGGGAEAGFYRWSGDSAYFSDNGGINISVHGAIGLDYRFKEVPVNLSLDWKPTFIINGYGNGFGAGYGALSVRYILGE